MKLPDFGALFRLLDRVLSNWDEAQKRKRERERLKHRADEIMSKHERALDAGLLSERNVEELNRIMEIKNAEERHRALVEFDERTRKPR